ncbi:hypothetical protein R1sor_012375 [Riccia sorocarpa]|uniref:Uncharacterized protein n=1 Tax=Riccia sorocarpa TaxID=122646 RepID=A0ABD3I9S9_9MARC
MLIKFKSPNVLQTSRDCYSILSCSLIRDILEVWIDDDEYEQPETAEEPVSALKGRGKKSTKGARVDDEEFDVESIQQSVESEYFGDKKRDGKKGKKGANIDDDEYETAASESFESEQEQTEKPEDIVFSNRKKSRKERKEASYDR